MWRCWRPRLTGPKSCPRCGQNARLRAAAREREVRTLSGVVRIVRNYHYCEACKHGFYPRDRMLGLPEDGELTAEMEKRVVDFALNDTDASAAKRFSMHYGQSVSANLMRRASERVGMRLEACRPEALAQALTPESGRPAKVLTVFRILLAAELKAAGATRAEQVVWLGDGAPGNWTLASSLCPEATQIQSAYGGDSSAIVFDP